MGRKAEKIDIDIAMEDLEEIPTQRLEWCFKQARKNNEYQSPPTNNRICKEWAKIGNDGRDIIMETMKRRLENEDFILRGNNFISVASPGESKGRVISAREFINEAIDYVRMRS